MNQLNVVLVDLQQSPSSNLDATIAERRAYYKQQESLIEQQAQEGNQVLLGLRYAIQEAELILRDLKMQCRNAKGNLQQLEDDMEMARQEFLQEVAEHEQRMSITIVGKI